MKSSFSFTRRSLLAAAAAAWTVPTWAKPAELVAARRGWGAPVGTTQEVDE
jgi:hypothetical protein